MDSYQSEIVIALACAVGTDILSVTNTMQSILKEYNYDTHIIKISSSLLVPLSPNTKNEEGATRINHLMDLGNTLRETSQDAGILAKGAIHQISLIRQQKTKDVHKPSLATAYIIDSLKNPEEVVVLRNVYGSGFYLFAINESERARIVNLFQKNVGQNDAEKLINRDKDEGSEYGQNTRKVFELADFHLSLNINDGTSLPKSNNKDNKERIIQAQINRTIKAIFANPFITPTFDEFAMFMAYSSGLRSADLSRQVGAVIASPNKEIIATGANDCPRFRGGQYWPILDNDTFEYQDEENGRDYKRGFDPNKKEYLDLVDEIVDLFDFGDSEEGQSNKEKTRARVYQSRIRYLTEFGRAVHAEMAAILSCARMGISLQDSTLYCTTFPCHNCAKHIVGSGIKRVVFIEPYPKSKAVELFSDSIQLGGAEDESNKENHVCFEEFVGIGPRRFFDLFSMKLSSGMEIIRKDEKGNIVNWCCNQATVRCIMQPTSYFEREEYGVKEYLEVISNYQSGD